MNNTTATLDDILLMRKFLSAAQFATMVAGEYGEERAHFLGKIAEYAQRIRDMPKVGDEPAEGIAFLHYFHRGGDWWILEKDCEPVQHQAFGYARLTAMPDCAELGYISIVELIMVGAELDLHWTPTPLNEIKQL